MGLEKLSGQKTPVIAGRPPGMKDKGYSGLIGKIGVTDTELRPSGVILIDNEIYNVETDGELVEAGRGVKVTRVRGKKIFVKRV
jgi:membrane-bound ClpP family serine protease